MKKTIIALAALGAFGAASAQVTLSGGLGFAFQQSIKGGPLSTANTAALAKSNHQFAIPDGFLGFTAVEDLGNGLSVKANLNMDLQGRGQGSPTSTDATLTVNGGFGTLVGGSLEAGNGIVARGTGGAPVSLAYGPADGLVLNGPANVDLFRYISPSFGGAKFMLSRTDEAGTALANSRQSNGVAVLFDGAGVSFSADFTAYEQSIAQTAAGAADTRIRVSASYDFGIAKIGAGMQQTKATVKNAAGEDKNTNYVVGFSVPVGAVKVGAFYAHNDQKAVGVAANPTAAGAAATDGVFAKTQIGVGADYALSKRTTLNASYGQTTKGTLSANYNDQYRIRLLHTF